jgi:hypothetical protein
MDEYEIEENPAVVEGSGGPLYGDGGPDESQSESKEKRKKRVSGWVYISSFLIGINAILFMFINPYVALLLACAGILAAIRAIKKIDASGKKLLGRRVAVGAIISQAIIFAAQAFWRIDAPPIPNDYTIADLKSAPSEFNESYAVLLSLADPNEYDPGAPGIGLTAEDVKILDEVNRCFEGENFESIYAAIDANSGNIVRIWDRAVRGREIVEKLIGYDKIADLAEPSFEYDVNYHTNLRNMVWIYKAYICLQCREHNFDEATNELIKLNELNQKLNIYSRTLIGKLVYMGFAAVNIQTANFIVNHPGTPGHCVEQLADTFQRLSEEQASMRNQIIFEYLMTKGFFEKLYEDAVEEQDMPLMNNEYVRSMYKKSFNRSLLKYNSTLRLSRNFHDRWLAYDEGRERTEDDEYDVWPGVYLNLPVEIDANGKVSKYYFFYNPIGALMAEIMMPMYDKVFQVRSKYMVHSDLLQIVLNRKLGRVYSVKARDFSEEYVIDLEKGRVLSPGPDGVDYTEDDIYLLINPRE